MVNETTIANLKISAVTKAEFLRMVKSRLGSDEKTFVITPNSEFLYASLHHDQLRDLFNSADIALVDGIAIPWAERFLAVPFRSPNFYLKVFEAWLQVIVTGARILLTPKYLYKNIPEKITGADVFFDLVSVAQQEKFSIYLLGGRAGVANKLQKLLLQSYPQLSIVGASDKSASDSSVTKDIQTAKPDMVFVAFGQPKQEKWIAAHLKTLPIKFAMGVGGTFDYAVGEKLAPPKWIRQIGLEWLFRLFTQPARLPRIYRATWGLVLSLVRFKVYHSFPLRKNAAIVVVNQDNKVLICKRVPAPPTNGQVKAVLDNYWQFPQGGLDADEELVQGAQRELLEETGITSVELISVAKYINQYEWRNGARQLFFAKSRRLFRGQDQETVFMRFTGNETEIQLDGIEFNAYQWVTMDQAVQMLEEERKEHAQQVFAELSDHLEKTA